MNIKKQFKLLPGYKTDLYAIVDREYVVLHDRYGSFTLLTDDFLSIAENVKLLQSQFGE